MQFWEIVGHKLDSSCWQANNVFWQNIRCLRGKWYYTANSIKHTFGDLLRNEKNIRGTWVEYPKDLKLRRYHTSRQTRGALEEENAITTAGDFLSVKTLKARKAADTSIIYDQKFAKT